jgi:transglutaminase-like putative cysteine protease
VATVAVTPVRIGLVTLLGVLLAVVAGGVFDGTQAPLFVVPVLVGPAALAVHRRRWPARVGVALLAACGGVVLAVVLAGGSVGDAAEGVLRGPRRLLTTEWPSPSDPTIIAAVAALIAVVTAAAVDLAGRERLHLTTFVPIVTGLATLFALGAPVRPAPWVTVALGVTSALVVVARPGDTLATRRRTLVGERTLLVSVVTIVAVAIGTSATFAWADRANPRRIEDAELTAALVDPVEAMVALRKAEPVFDIIELTDRSTLIGQSLPSRWRLAALDGYDGQRWVPKLTIRPIGGRLGLPSPPAPDRSPPITYDIVFRTDDLDLVPFPGRPLSIDTDVETDLDRIVVRLAEPPRPGTTLRAVSEVAPTVVAARTTAFSTRQVDDVAATFSELAANLAGDGTVLEQLQRIERTMAEDWQLDPSAPGGGQQLALIDRFVTDTRRGTEEQFVTAFVLLARSLGFDARVATGFVVPPEQLTVPLVLRSSHASVWPEVQLDGAGWLAFDPAPPRPTTDEDEPPPPPEAQSPAAAQPPIAPPADTRDEDDETVLDASDDAGRWGSLGTWIARAGVVGGLAVFPFVAAIGAIAATKWARRRRRLRSDDPARRIRGAWANATDSLVDAGLTIAPSWTDDRIARHAALIAPAAPHEARRLAAMATAMTFGSTDDGWRLVDDAVHTSAAIDTAIRSQRTRWQRVRWRLSLRSLRRTTRSPVPG